MGERMPDDEEYDDMEDVFLSTSWAYLVTRETPPDFAPFDVRLERGEFA